MPPEEHPEVYDDLRVWIKTLEQNGELKRKRTARRNAAKSRSNRGKGV